MQQRLNNEPCEPIFTIIQQYLIGSGQSLNINRVKITAKQQ